MEILSFLKSVGLAGVTEHRIALKIISNNDS